MKIIALGKGNLFERQCPPTWSTITLYNYGMRNAGRNLSRQGSLHRRGTLLRESSFRSQDSFGQRTSPQNMSSSRRNLHREDIVVTPRNFEQSPIVNLSKTENVPSPDQHSLDKCINGTATSSRALNLLAYDLSNLEPKKEKWEASRPHTLSQSTRKKREEALYPALAKGQSTPDFDTDTLLSRARIQRSGENATTLLARIQGTSMQSINGNLMLEERNSAHNSPYITSGLYDSRYHTRFRFENNSHPSSNALNSGQMTNCKLPVSGQSGNHQLPLLPQIEICPGMFIPLRGSEETWRALKNGKTESVDCFCCQVKLLCVVDAKYVLCPECRVVSPAAAEKKQPPGILLHGVGLGVVVDAFNTKL